MINALDVFRQYQDSASERDNRRNLAELAQQKFAAEQQMMPGQLEGQRLSNLGKIAQMRNMEDVARREDFYKHAQIQNQADNIRRQEAQNRAQQEFQTKLLDSRERMIAARGQGRNAQVIQTENGPMTLGPDGRAAEIIGPDGMPVKAKSLEKALPTSAAKSLMENQTNLRRAEQAVALLQGKDIAGMTGDAEATGKKGMLSAAGVVGDKVLNFLDPKGVDTRAAVGDLGSLLIHDRSGAAVTASEFPRLRPFVPLATDSPEVARKKAQRFAQEYRNVQQEMADFYKESGYKVPVGALRAADAESKPSGAMGTNDMPDPSKYEGKTMTDTQSGIKYISRGGKWLKAGS